MQLAARLRAAWTERISENVVTDIPKQGMGGEDFSRLMNMPTKSAVYWDVGGTPVEDFERAAAGGAPVAGHHSALFKIASEPSVRLGVESTVVALLELMGDQ